MGRLFAVATVIVLAAQLTACAEPVQNVQVPAPNDPRAYVPAPAEKPLPPEYTGQQPQGQPMPAGQPGTGGQGAPGPGSMAPPPAPQMNAAQIASAGNAMAGEETFVKAYNARRNPRLMVFVNRTITGEVLPKEGLNELLRVEESHAATGAVKVSGETAASTQKNSATAGVGYAGSVADATAERTNKSSKNSFESGGAVDYTKTTSLKVAADKLDEIGASREDYALIELSLLDYLDCGGRVTIYDSEVVRNKLDREKVLRIENGDGDALRLLSTELQTDVLIQVKATPTRHSQWPQGAVRLTAKVLSTTDGRILSATFVDMPLPMSKTNVNVFTRYLAEQIMTKLSAVWSGVAVWDPMEVRIYKAKSVDETIDIKNYIKRLPGVMGVNTRGATAASKEGYATLSVAYEGAPEDFYEALRENLKGSKGLKAVDLQSNTVNVEVVGELELKAPPAPAATAPATTSGAK